MNKLLILALSGCLGAAAIVGVHGATVKGLVVDKNGETLPGAAVQLLQMPDTISRGYILAGEDGDFSFPNVDPGKYYLLATMVSMQDGLKEVAVSDSAQIVDAGRIILGDDAIMLDEAVVTAIKAAVVAKQDTLEFNAGSYHTAPNATVNDLLKKLPGVEVGTDGTITSNGKTITKILVDGKEFFSDDTQMATKNLPSNIVDKVQVVDRKSDLARLTGVDDGEEETVINLTVKKDMNNGWFGSVGGGYGTDSRYEGNFIINHFFNGNQLTLLGGLNNTNENGFMDGGRGMFRGGFGGTTGINSSQWFGLNFNVGNEEKFRIGGNVRYSHTDRDARSRTATQFLFPDSVSYQDANTNLRDKGHNINADFRVQWNIDESNTIEFRPRFSMNIRETDQWSISKLRAGDATQSEVNSNENSNYSRGTNLNASGELVYNHKFASRPGRSLSFRGQYQLSRSRQKSTSLSNILYFLQEGKDEELDRWLDNHTWSNALDARLTWTEPLGDVARGNFLNIAYRVNYKWNNADKLTYEIPDYEGVAGSTPLYYPEAPEGSVFDPDLSNSFRNKFFTQELQVGYKKVSKTLRLDAGLLFAPSSSKSDDLINSERNIPTRWVWNVSPYANVRWRITDSQNLGGNYRARTSQPSMTQLQPVADVSDPLNIVVGNPDLKPTFTQSVRLFYNNYNKTTQQSLMGMVNASYAMNSIVSKTVTNPTTGGRTTTYGNVNGNFQIFGMGMLTQPFANRHWRFNARLGVNFASTPGYINGEYNRIGNLKLNPSAGLTYSNDLIQISAAPTYSFGSINNTLPQQADRITHSYGVTGDVSVYLPFGLELSSDIAFSKSSGYSAGFNSSEVLWNAKLSYSFLSDKSLTIYARAYDLLGQNKNISRSVSANAIVDTEYNDLTRYFMFGLTWNFSTLKKKGSKANYDGGPDSGLPGPPPGEDGRPGERGEHGGRGERPQGGGPAGRPAGGFGGGRPPF